MHPSFIGLKPAVQRMVMKRGEVSENNFLKENANLIVVSMGLNKKYVENPLTYDLNNLNASRA